MLKKILCCFLVCSLLTSVAVGQQKVWSSSDIQIGLEKLGVLGSVLYFAAHPDDENTRLISWLAQEQKYRTGYLSLTRGEGGQNLIGTDLGIDLGLIRTEELLAARDIDKGEQFFSSAYDFGFSKTHQETFHFWDKERTLAEAVYIIRKFRPDIIITRFPPDKRGGHGHHQASAILAHEAFLAAADPTRFPEQLKTVQPWKAQGGYWCL
jgi:LmbE family N-acetylglucosaminyl deacetylase